MKTKMMILAAVALLLAGTSSAWAGTRNTCTGGSDNAVWSAAANTSVAIGSTGSTGVNMTSPTCLNSYSTFPGTLSVYGDITLDASTCPDGTSGTTATCTLVPPVAAITNNPLAYTAFGQTQTYNVSFDATSATRGYYTFHVHANASDPNQQGLNQSLSGYGWGYGGGAEVTVIVTEPQATCLTSDALNVSFSQPDAGNVTFCSGGTSIPIDISAADTSNLITSLAASVNSTDISSSLTITGLNTTTVTGTGSYTAGAVGAYKFNATAHTACTTGSADVTVDLVYAISDLLPPLGNGAKPKAGNAAPIKFIPTDCSGAAVPYDSSVHIKVYQGTSLLQDATPGGCTGGSCGTGGSSNVQYDSTTGQYSTVFQTGNTAGITYTVQVWFGGVMNFQTTFMTK